MLFLDTKKTNRIVDFFDKIYTGVQNKSLFLTRIKYYSLKRCAIRLTANFAIALYYSITRNDKNSYLTGSDKKSERLIVSLTTFPERISRVYLVIETILRQTHKPDMIVLYLSKEQFPGPNHLPAKLLKQQKKGLRICFCEGDLKSHKKYFYALQEYPLDFLITVDDDIFYPVNLIERLVDLNRDYPASVCCHRGCYINVENNQIAPYRNWKPLKGKMGPSSRVFQTSGGGTIYPPSSLHQDVLNDEIFKSICFQADDLWLNCMAYLKGTLTVKSSYYSVCLPVLFFKNKKLNTFNVIADGNDKQFEMIRNYYKKEKNVILFGDIFEDAGSYENISALPGGII